MQSTSTPLPPLSRSGFTLIEIIGVICILGLLVSSVVGALKSDVVAMNNSAYSVNARSLNAAMMHYRAYRSQGYTPATPWSAVDAQGVLNELAKPLRLGTAEVVLIPRAAITDVSSLRVTVDRYDENATWSPIMEM